MTTNLGKRAYAMKFHGLSADLEIQYKGFIFGKAG